MVLDGESLLLAPRAAELIAASEGAGLPGTLKSELFASALELNTDICASADEAAEALAELRRGAAALAEERGLDGRRRREPSDQPRRGPGDRRRAALRGVRRVRGRLGAAAGRQRAPRPRRDAERRTPASTRSKASSRGCRSCSRSRRTRRTSPARRRGCCRTGPRCLRSSLEAARRRRFAPTRTGRSSSSASRGSASRPTTRASGGTSARIRASGRSRSGCPTSRRRSSAPSASSTVLVELCRAVLDRPQRAYDPAARGLYQQNRWAAARFGLGRRALPPGRRAHGEGASSSPPSSRRRDGWTRRRPRPSASSRSGRSRGLEAVCADLVERTLG